MKLTGAKGRKAVLHFLIIILGNAIAASASALFVIPNGLVMGGTTGLGIFIGRFWNEELVSVVVLIANVILYLIGVILLGKRFATTTLLGTVLYPTFMGIFSAAVGDRILTENRMLACICAALLMGTGIGIVVREGASTGGTDIPPLILHKFFGLPVSVGLWLVDLFVVLIQAFVVPLESVLYGIVTVILYTFVLDRVSPIGMKKTQVKIISERYAEIKEMIVNELSLGVTVLYGQTGFLKEDCHMLLTIVSNRNLVRLRNEVLKIDPVAFMTVSVVSEVRGRGFSTERVYLSKPERSPVSAAGFPEEEEDEESGE